MTETKYILAIESSCDDTSVAIVTTNYHIVKQLTTSQPEHLCFGGVLPELASRLHMKNILLLVENCLMQSGLTLQEMSAVAISINPGLIGSLLVGLSFTKSLAWGLKLPLITVNHMLGHVYANHLNHGYIKPPYLALIVSGGHTELIHFKTDSEITYVGKTLDDAAGETFDKTAKLLHLGYPGGPLIDKLSEVGNPAFLEFPRALRQKDNFNFSYSGLKTSVLQYLAKQQPDWIASHKADLAASIQSAIIDPLISKTVRYAKLNGIKTILLAGGVAANSMLRKQLKEKAASIHAMVYFPAVSLCMDNAAMIASAAIPKLVNQQYSNLSVNAFSDKGTRII
jgi:N6-L-threonylcarbamoyladenine synthase